MEKKQQIRQRLTDISHIPDEIYGIKLSELDKEKLSYGEWSSLHENFHLPSGSVKDGKIKLVKNNKGEVEYNFQFQKEKLEIPEKVGNKKLSKEQIDDLHKGKTVLLAIDDRDLFVKVDKELNCISISTGKEIGIPDEMGGYKLTSDDKEKLANGQNIGARVFKGKDGYFMANIRLSQDKNEMLFMDIKTIEKHKDVQHYIAKFNIPATEKTSEQNKEIKQKEKIIEKENKNLENTVSVAANAIGAEIKDTFGKEDFYKAVDEKNTDKLKEMTGKGFIPEQTELDYLINHKALNGYSDQTDHLIPL